MDVNDRSFNIYLEYKNLVINKCYNEISMAYITREIIIDMLDAGLQEAKTGRYEDRTSYSYEKTDMVGCFIYDSFKYSAIKESVTKRQDVLYLIDRIESHKNEIELTRNYSGLNWENLDDLCRRLDIAREMFVSQLKELFLEGDLKIPQ